MVEAILSQIVLLVRQLPGSLLTEICDRLDELPATASASEMMRTLHCVVLPEPRSAAAALIQRWSSENAGPPGALSWAIRSAQAARKMETGQQWEMVWSGPQELTGTLRRTEQVLLDVIQTASVSVTLMTFAAYKIPHVTEALVQAMRRGVRVRIIVESATASEGKVTFDAIKALGPDVAAHAAVYIWPLDRRFKVDGKHGSLHAKCALVDDTRLLISSANLTDYALNLNMELGVYVRGGSLPPQLARHLQWLIDQQVLVRVPAEP